MRTNDLPESPRRRKKVLRRFRKTPDKLIKPASEERFEVWPEEAGTRLDMFLKKRLRWRSRTAVQALLLEREITSAGNRLDRAYKVKPGETIILPLPPPPEEAGRIHTIPLNIIYEDDILVILNKPPDLVVHPAGRHKYDTLINALHLRYRDLQDPEKDILPRLAHRIDRETSGALVGYKMRRHDRNAPIVFEKAAVRKEYLALAEGVFEQDEGVIDLPMGREQEKPHGIALMEVRADGVSARTGYKVEERFKRFTLVRCRLFTGRMHQIRVHLKALGHPIVCDKSYGLRKELRLSDARVLREGEEDRPLMTRQALHSFMIEFAHPVTGETLHIEAPLPADMMETITELRKA